MQKEEENNGAVEGVGRVRSAGAEVAEVRCYLALGYVSGRTVR